MTLSSQLPGMNLAVILIDGPPLMRMLLQERLGAEGNLTVIGNFATPSEALSQAASLNADVALIDIDTLKQNCLEAAQQLRQASPETQVLFLSSSAQSQYVDRALVAGVRGYVTKDEPPDDLVAALLEVGRGETYYGPKVVSRIVDEYAARLTEPEPLSQGEPATIEALSPRESEILSYIAQGYSKRETADQLNLSVSTVTNHTHSMMVKLGIRNSVKLARFAYDEGLITLPEVDDDSVEQLTPREAEALKHMAAGLTAQEIAEVVNISVKTVANHIHSLKNKLGIRNRVKLALFAIRSGLA